MNRREILNELQQIVAITDTVGSDYGIPEASRRAKGLIQVIESWPTAFPPAPFVSNQCCERHHGECQLGSANQPFSRLCNCACHCPPEAPQQPTQPDPPAARHIDTPDELLELLAGISSDPQVEGLSLSQKASTMALLYAAKALQEIAESTEALLMNSDFIGETLVDRSVKAKSKQEPPTDAPFFYGLTGEHTAAWESWAQSMAGLAHKFEWMLINASNRAGMRTPPVQSPTIAEEPS